MQRQVAFSPPPVIDENGALLTRASFRDWLECQSSVGSLEALVTPIINSRRQLDGPTPITLADAVAEACYGAHVFDILDWRKRYRDRDASLRRQSKKLRKWLAELEELLLEHDLRLAIITQAVEAHLRKDVYGPTFVLPEPQEFFVLDVLKALAIEIEPRSKSEGFQTLPFTTCHGCLDYGRPVQGQKVRSSRQMLAFNLVYLFRAATTGQWATEGHMPRGGRPCADLVARLVGTTCVEGEKDAPVTAEWVTSTIKSILLDNKLVRVTHWPGGRNEPSFRSWFIPRHEHT